MLARETEQLRRKVVANLTGAPSLQPLPYPPKITSEGPATDADLDNALNPVKQSLMELVLTVNQLNRKPEPAQPELEHRQRSTDSDVTYEIPLTGAVFNWTVTITNRGKTVVVNPRVIVNGRRDWFSTSTILNEILRPDMSDREKALAIWTFVTANRRHDDPCHKGIELIEPVRLFNIYGYGFCKHAAAALAILAESAGLRARVWELAGHVVPEVYFEGGWRMLDPDHKVYYFEDDGKTIAGVETLEVRPDLIRKRGGKTEAEELVKIYTSTGDNHVSSGWYPEIAKAIAKNPHTMGYSLRRGESLMRSWSNWGKYFSALYYHEPEVYANGRFIYAPEFASDRGLEGAEAAANVHVTLAQGTWVLAPATPERTGDIVYRFSSPYPFVDAAVELQGTIPTGARMQLSFSENGGNWRTVWTSGRGTQTRETIRTGGCLRNGYGRPLYTYFLKLSLSGTAQVRSLRFTSDIQVAPLSLPALESGKNVVRYVDETSASRDVEIVFAYDRK